MEFLDEEWGEHRAGSRSEHWIGEFWRVCGAERRLRHGPRGVRDWLCRIYLLARYVRLGRDRRLDDWEERCARRAIQRVHVAGLRQRRDRLDLATTNAHVEQR